MTVDVFPSTPFPLRTTPAIRPEQVGVIEAPFWRVLTFLVLTRTQPSITDPARSVRHHPPRVRVESLPAPSFRPRRVPVRAAPLRHPHPTHGGIVV